MSAVPPAESGKAGSLPDLPPLPEITDTSYMTAAFKAPPRHPVLPEEEDGAATAATGTSAGSGGQGRGKETPNAAASRSEGKIAGVRYDADLEAEEARFMSTYRNPLEERIRWEPVKVTVPGIWWFLLAVTFVMTLALVIVYLTMPSLYQIHPDENPHVLGRLAILATTVLGASATFALIRKSPFWSFLHLVYGATTAFWGLGGVTITSWIAVDSFLIEAVDADSKAEAVAGVVPVALWFAFILLVPLVIVPKLLPPWERRAGLLRFGAGNIFWGAFCGVSLTMILPHVHEHSTGQLLFVLALAVLPVGGIFALGIAIALPVRWPVSRDSFLPPLLGFLAVAMGLAVLFAFAVVPDVKPLGRVVLTFLALAFAMLAVFGVVVSTRAHDPMRATDMEGLVEWVDADIIHPDEHAFMCDEAAIHRWAREALRRGVFLAARDFYRATSELAFTPVDAECSRELAETVQITRRKLEAAGVPPRPDFDEFSEKPIFPDPLD